MRVGRGNEVKAWVWQEGEFDTGKNVVIQQTQHFYLMHLCTCNESEKIYET